jgi:DNA-binding response OmpR family regulator
MYRTADSIECLIEGIDMPDNPILSGLRVLVVEDDALITMLLEDLLEECGCQVVGPAATIAEAKSLIEAATFDVALLDLNLGHGQTTYDLAGTLGGREVPFAFVTGLDALSLRDPFKTSTTLQKPFRMDELERVLTQLVASRS